MKQVSHSTILCIDDDADDLEMLQDAIYSVDTNYQLVKAYNGEEGLMALSRLKRTGQLPCLIILDINMPKIDGRQVFQFIKADVALRDIPVVVFSTSNSETDKSYFTGKQVEYITKPYCFSHLLQVAESLLSYCR
jgi:CheY-like chemotaxis protein